MIESVLFWTSIYVGVFAVLYMFCAALYNEVKQVIIHAMRIHDEEMEEKKSSASK